MMRHSPIKQQDLQQRISSISTNYFLLKRDITEYKTLSNYELYMIENLSNSQYIEIIELYNDMLSGIADLIGYRPMTDTQKEYLQKINRKEKISLIHLYNETMEEINSLTLTL
jgi:hypothetical protein